MNTLRNTGQSSDETKLTVRMPADVADGMKASANANDRSLNGEIVRALREYLARQQRQTKRQD